MEPFIQMSRLPDDDAGGHVPGPGGQPPAGRPPDFTDNMMARIDAALFPSSIVEKRMDLQFALGTFTM